MTYNRFYLIITLKLLLILLNCFVLAYVSMYYGSRFFTALVLLLMVVFQFTHLLNYVNKTNRELAKFLVYLREGNPTIVFNEQKFERNFANLYVSYQKVKKEFSRLRTDKEKNHILLQNVTEHLATPFIAILNNEELIISNRAANEVLGSAVNQSSLKLEQIHPDLLLVLKSMKNNQERLFKTFAIKEKPQSFLLQSTEFKLGNDYIKLISFLDIEEQMEGKEIESYHKLVRILAHEISNSINPITMLVGNIKMKSANLLDKDNTLEDSDSKGLQDIKRSAEIIETRGNGLIDFINAYKNFTATPHIEMQKVEISSFLSKSLKIFEDKLKEYEITTEISISKDLPPFVFDPHQIEQLMINLIKNAIHACEFVSSTRKITLKAYADKSFNYIEVIDNGIGIEKDMLDKIFIPFFTTKKEGSGIGLSFSKNIMHLHQGQIFAFSEPSVETKFVLKFKKD